MDAATATRQAIEGGIGAELAAAFAAVAEATASDGDARYPPSVPARLARAIACRNYAPLLLQLCHFVNAADAAGSGAERYEALLFGLDRVTPRTMRNAVTHAVERRGWRRAGFQLTREGVAIRYSDGVFNVPFARMPLLVAAAELLIGLVDYGEIDAAFCEMLDEPHRQAAVKTASNRLARALYRLLASQLASRKNQERYRRIVDFLSARRAGGEVSVDDGAILAFWQDASADPEEGRDFRLYRTVLLSFVSFIETVRGADDKDAMAHALRLGGDRAAGEVEPAALEGAVESAMAWRSPLDVLEDEPAARIKFLNSKESASLRDLLALGPLAFDLPLSLLRAETFGATQRRITQALRDKAGGNDLAVLCGCRATQSYVARVEDYGQTAQYVRRAMLASLHAIRRGEGEPAAEGPDAQVFEEAARVFRGIARSGFRHADLDDPEILEGHRVAADALAATSAHLASFLDCLARTGERDPLPARFATDREIFSGQFGLLYLGRDS